MALESDGDVVRGLGFVTLYSAYLEEEIDNLLQLLESIDSSPTQHLRWPISRRLKKAKKLVTSLRAEELSELLADLDACGDLFERRNELVHGRIYSNYGRGDEENAQLHSGRPDIEDREITPQELYDLANVVFGYQGAIRRPQLFKLPRILSGKGNL